MSEKATAIWTPEGIVTLDGKKPDRVELRAGLMEWAVQFSLVAPSLHWGLHCAKCKQDIVGKNSGSDKVYAMTCGCTEWVGGNRDYQPPPRVN